MAANLNANLFVPRRTFLRGVGTLMALPFLESIAPIRSLGAESGIAGALTSSGAPRRMAFIYVPNGANMPDWTPKTEGTGFEFPHILQPLQEFRSDINVLSGLTQDAGRAKADGAGDHARASATWLTSTRIRKTNGVDIQAGISADQVVAQKIGQRTRFASLELGCDRSQLSGNCDSGYSCAYSYNIAWKTESTPLPPEVDPRLAFERLFTNGDPSETAETRARRERYQKSVLDFVQEDAKQLHRKLGRTDQRKLDEYLTAVRDLERRIETAHHSNIQLAPSDKPTGIPATFEAHARLMFDIMVLAFQTDVTRVTTFVVRHDGSNEPYPEVGVKSGHHDLSHHGNDEAKRKKLADINRFHAGLFAYFLKRMKETKEGEGSLLDNSMIVYGSGLADPDHHSHDNLPVVLAGRGGGSITGGRHIRFEKETPMANLFLSMMDRMGVQAPRFGDSTGKLGRLS